MNTLRKLDMLVDNLHIDTFEVIMSRKNNINAFDDDLERTWETFKIDVQILKDNVNMIERLIKEYEER